MEKYEFEFPSPPEMALSLEKIDKDVDLLYAEYKKLLTLDLSKEYRITLAKDYVNELSNKISSHIEERVRFCNFHITEYSKENQFYYFLHIPRCGGYSVNKTLKDCKINHVKAVSAEAPVIKFAHHVSAHQNFKDYFSHGTFCDISFDPKELKARSIKIISTVRNPYSWLVSMYFFGESLGHTDSLYEYMNSLEGCGNLRKLFPTFKDFFNFFIKEAEKSDPICWLLPFRVNPFFQLWNSSGELIPDEIIKLENIQEELTNVLGIEYIVPSINKGSANCSYREYYDKDMIEQFEERFGNLLNYFEYSF